MGYLCLNPKFSTHAKFYRPIPSHRFIAHLVRRHMTGVFDSFFPSTLLCCFLRLSFICHTNARTFALSSISSRCSSEIPQWASSVYDAIQYSPCGFFLSSFEFYYQVYCQLYYQCAIIIKLVIKHKEYLNENP